MNNDSTTADPSPYPMRTTTPAMDTEQLHAESPTEMCTEHQPTPKKSAAHRVFAIPELYEQILSHTRLCDLFRAAAVSRSWRDAFSSSTFLMKKAQLYPDGGSERNLIKHEHEFDEQLGLRVLCWDCTLVDECRLNFELSFPHKKDLPIHLTDNLRACLATQPPCYTMEIRPWCCHDNREFIMNPLGITIGDVADAARRIHAEHHNCPEFFNLLSALAPSHYPVFRGVAKVPINYKGRTMAIEKRAKERQQYLEAEERTRAHEKAGWGFIWYAFRKARRDAAAQNQKLPRWPRFLAENEALVPSGYPLSHDESNAAAFARHLTDPSDELFGSDEDGENPDDEETGEV